MFRQLVTNFANFWQNDKVFGKKEVRSYNSISYENNPYFESQARILSFFGEKIACSWKKNRPVKKYHSQEKFYISTFSSEK